MNKKNKQFVGVVLAAVVSNVIGTLWYSPYAFGPQWAQLLGIDFNVEMPIEPIVYGFLLSLFVAWMLSSIIKKLKLKQDGALRMAFVGWLTFLVPYGVQGCIYAQVPLALFAINVGYNLAVLLAMVAVITHINKK